MIISRKRFNQEVEKAISEESARRYVHERIDHIYQETDRRLRELEKKVNELEKVVNSPIQFEVDEVGAAIKPIGY